MSFFERIGDSLASPRMRASMSACWIVAGSILLFEPSRSVIPTIREKPNAEGRTCGSADIHKAMLESDGNFRAAQLALSTSAQLRETLFNEEGAILARPMVRTIQVVVHVVYHDDIQNISDDQIASQLKVLNEDFRKKNPDSSTVPKVFEKIAGDTYIEFRIARVDPSGVPTPGITRTKTEMTEFDSRKDDVKFAKRGGHDAWDTHHYLNIWIAPKITDPKYGALLGYAHFPGGDVQTDGVVILYTAFGTIGTATPPFHLGRTSTHEIGHYLNLIHIWGDDDGACTGTDEVSDTPNQAGPNSGTPTFPHVTCNNGPRGDMFMSYMDYVDDPNMKMFSTGQCLRMQATVDGPRSGIVMSVSSNGPTSSPTSRTQSLTSKLTNRWILDQTKSTPFVAVYVRKLEDESSRRGGEVIEFGPDQKFTRSILGPNDVPTSIEGTWSLESDSILVQAKKTGEKFKKLEVLGVGENTLMLKKEK